MNNYEFNLPKETRLEINMAKRAGIQNDYYPQLVETLIELRYNVKQELAINRQRDTKPLEFEEYNAYCQACKLEAKRILGIEE